MKERWEEELYPFLGDERGSDGGSRGDPTAVLEDVGGSTRQKAGDVSELRERLWDRHADDLVRAARLLARALGAGGKVLAFGNGGSATDAQDLVMDLTEPPVDGWSPFPAIDLTADHGVLTAVANDVSVESVFVRQVIAYGDEGDVAVGFSTSGESENVLQAFRQARDRGMTTIGFTGFEGGRMAGEGFLDVCVIAPSSYVPRIQEAHATAYHALLEMTHSLLGEGDRG